MFTLSSGHGVVKRLTVLALSLVACQRAPNTAEMQKSAEFYLAEGGLTFHPERAYQRPCLQSVNLQQTLIGGVFPWPGKIVDLAEKHRFAQVERQQRPSGYVAAKLTPLDPYKTNWVGDGDSRSFCFGRIQLVKAEPVADARPITAGADQPYLIPGTQAISTRITFKLTDVPGGSFTQDVDADRTVLARGSMRPTDYGKEFTVVATLPEKVENYKLQP